MAGLIHQPVTVNILPGVIMNDRGFEPFQDRLSRDIRNDLSESILEVIKEKSLHPAEEVAAEYLQKDLQPCYEEYINSRLSRYEQARAKIAAENNPDPLWQGLVLWDLGLFFEVHEVLEHTWLRSEGEEKLLLQAMIRAAGVYIKLEYGYDVAARKIADKALPVLEQSTRRLSRYTAPERLIAALRSLQAEPPQLLQEQGGS